MTTFEIIILSIIYLICYGFTSSMFIKERKVWAKWLHWNCDLKSKLWMIKNEYKEI